MGLTTIRLSTDEDMLRFEPHLEMRVSRRGNVKGWDQYHLEAVREIDRRLRTRRAQADQFEIGRLGERSRENLRDVATWFALHFLFVGEDQQGSGDNYFERKASLYFSRAAAAFDAEAAKLDYDFDNSGTITHDEQQRPFPAFILRG